MVTSHILHTQHRVRGCATHPTCELHGTSKQTIPSPTPKPQTKILWRVIAETSLPAAHSFSPSNSPTQNRACLSNISTYCVRLIWMCKNNIPLKLSPYACCRTIFTPFGRCRPTMRIIPCAGG